MLCYMIYLYFSLSYLCFSLYHIPAFLCIISLYFSLPYVCIHISYIFAFFYIIFVFLYIISLYFSISSLHFSVSAFLCIVYWYDSLKNFGIVSANWNYIDLFSLSLSLFLLVYWSGHMVSYGLTHSFTIEHGHSKHVFGIFLSFLISCFWTRA